MLLIVLEVEYKIKNAANWVSGEAPKPHKWFSLRVCMVELLQATFIRPLIPFMRTKAS